MVKIVEKLGGLAIKFLKVLSVHIDGQKCCKGHAKWSLTLFRSFIKTGLLTREDKFVENII